MQRAKFKYDHKRFEELYKQEPEFWKKFWKKYNEYNEPVNKLKRWLNEKQRITSR